MSGITLAQAQEQLDAWMAASLAVTKGQSYALNGKSYTRVNVEHIDKMILLWDRKVKELSDTASGTAVSRTYAKNGGRG